MNTFFQPGTSSEICRRFSRLLIHVTVDGESSGYYTALFRDVRITSGSVSMQLEVRDTTTNKVIHREYLRGSGNPLAVINTTTTYAAINCDVLEELRIPNLEILPHCVWVESLPKAGNAATSSAVLSVHKPLRITHNNDTITVGVDITELAPTQTGIRNYDDAILSINGITPNLGKITIRGVGAVSVEGLQS